jgi:hypothetical protein
VVLFGLGPRAEFVVDVLPAVGLEESAVNVEEHKFDVHDELLYVPSLKRVLWKCTRDKL